MLATIFCFTWFYNEATSIPKPCPKQGKPRCAAIVKAEQRELEISRAKHKNYKGYGAQ